MMASWMVYVLLVSTLLTIAALALERLASAQRWPLRWIWVGALVVSVLWPLGMTFVPAREQPVVASTTPAPSIAPPFTVDIIRPARAFMPSTPDGGDALNRAIAVVWIALSGLFVVRLAYSIAKLRRRARAWEHAVVDGVAVHLSASDGPAVVNLRPMSIVLPRWILSLDAPLRALVLQHEQEHRSARDPYLLLGASLLAALQPWNLGLWFAVRRLRLAIEIDCDARVLCVHDEPERYGLVMLTVAQRQSAAPAVFATMLSTSTTHLERRILAMQSIRHVARRTKAAAGILAAACLSLACALKPVKAQASNSSQGAFEAFMTAQGFKSWTTVHTQPGNTAPRYPEQLRARPTGGAVLTSFVVDTAGSVDSSSVKILESTNESFTASVRAVLPSMRFVAAEVDGRKVKQLVQLPFVFGVGDNAVLPAAMDTAHATMRCGSGACPVYRLAAVITTVAP